MSDYLKYLDKRPTQAYTLGPSGIGIAQAPFDTWWTAWFKEGKGVTYVKEAEFHADNPTGHFLSGSNDILAADSFTLTFDSGANVYAAVDNESLISVIRFSGGNAINVAAFDGSYPQLFNNSVIESNSNETFCFYIEEGSGIYYRMASESFNTGRPLYLQSYISVLNAVIKEDVPAYYRMQVFGLDSVGDGRVLVSNKFTPIKTGFFQSFESEPTGEVNLLSMWDLEEASRQKSNFIPWNADIQNFENMTTGAYSGQEPGLFSLYALLTNLFSIQNFENSPTGIISGAHSGVGNTYTFFQHLEISSDSFENSPTGSVNILIGSNNISGGFFINC
jgi:hypothetical protein